MYQNIILIVGVLMLTTSCNKALKSELAAKTEQIDQLNSQLEHLQNTSASLLDRMSELSVINQTDAKSIQNSLENINRQNSFIQNLTEKIQQKDSINFVLVSNLKRSLIDIDDEDIQVEVRGSAVYVSISDNLLFQSASSKVSPQAYNALSKVAMVINDHSQLNVLVEGHTDNVPISMERYRDNWDLSVLRATSVVRLLQDKYNVDPARLTAAGRSSYIPKMANVTSAGRAKNRRTEIIITPKLDQFFKLLESPALAD
jgi:chemotaxis protein MotB